jgi:hypothetical protein
MGSAARGRGPARADQEPEDPLRRAREAAIWGDAGTRPPQATAGATGERFARAVSPAGAARPALARAAESLVRLDLVAGRAAAWNGSWRSSAALEAPPATRVTRRGGCA